MRAQVALRPVDPTPLGDALPRLRTFVSPFTGVVRSLGETLHAPDEHRLISIGCQLADATPVIGETLDWYTGSEHWLREAAEAAAIGEALERYAGSFVPAERLVLGTAEELPAAVDPDRFALFSEEQYAASGFPYRPFRRDTRVAWVDGFALPDGEAALLPAQLVYMPWHAGTTGDVRIGHATSSGLACGPTLEEAVLNGLLELVERDAFMLAWHNRLSLPLLDWGDDPEIEPIDRRYFAPAGLRYWAVDLSVFLSVPAVLGVVHGRGRQLGALGVGAAAAPTMAVAWRKALAEAFSVQRWVRDRSLEHPEQAAASAHEIESFDGHTMFYADRDRAQRADFLVSSPKRRHTLDVLPLEGENVLELIEAITRRLRACNITAYAVDVTSPDVREAGLHVAHVVAPELCALDVVEGARFLGGRRLYHAAHDAGILPAPLSPADLNPDPHPFP